jgi:hypothetical protein
MLTSSKIDSYIYRYIINYKDITEITADNKDKLLGKEHIIRTPIFCLSPKGSYCAACAGGVVDRHPLQI